MTDTKQHATTGGDMPEPKVLIIGGGAAGLPAAIAAARLGTAVTLLEAGARVGKKILVTGNGRCNLTNTAVTPDAYNHPEFVGPVLSRHLCEDVRAFFGDMGLLTYADDEGRVYPVTNAAASVLEVLRLECEHLGVKTRCDFEAVRIAEMTDPAVLEALSADGDRVRADAVVVATGGGSLLGDAGHMHTARVPVLAPIKTESGPIRGLSGVRVRCAASLLDDAGERVATERGELLFRDYGVSGIMIFDLSRFLERGSTLSIDLFPDTSATAMQELLTQRCTALAWRTAGTFFDGMLHSRVAQAVLRAAGVDAKTPAADLPCDRLAAALKDFRLAVTGRGDATQAQVTRGGASVAGFDAHTMGSTHAPGLFAAGEVLDIDGRCGGYNLHWAWASGIVAGESAARFARRGASAGGSA